MKFLYLRKGVEVLILAIGLFLLFISLTMLSSPLVNQGVEAIKTTAYHQNP